MTGNERQLILDLATKRISTEEFYQKFPYDLKENKQYILELLKKAKGDKNPDDLYAVFLLGFTFKVFDQSYTSILNELILEDWHYKHEDIADILKKNKSPDSVEALYQTALKKFEYLSYDDSVPLINKCLYALFFIHTENAKNRVSYISEKSDKEEIVEEARELLEKWDEEGS